MAKKSVLDFNIMKKNGEKVAWTVAYDACFASYAENAGMDMILVGDSVGMIVYGYEGTVPVTMDQCIYHCQAVRAGAPNTYVIGDMPFGSYHTGVEDAVRNAVRFAKEGRVDCIKLEGGVAVADKIAAIAKAGIVVMGHIGLTPQSSAALGGFKTQGRTVDSARAIIEDAIAVYHAGARMLLLESVPEEVCAFVHEIMPIPVYGIGAGIKCDGQVVLCADMLGMFSDFTPKFARKYADIAGIATAGFRQYVAEVKTGAFPGPENKYKISGDPDDFITLFDEYDKKFNA